MNTFYSYINNIFLTEVAKEIKQTRKMLTIKQISIKMNCREDDVKLVCYNAATTLKEDYSCHPWS